MSETDLRAAGTEAASRRPRRALFFYGAIPALNALNAAVGLLLPLLLDPVEFGRYAIVVTLFQYGLIFDIGLSQLTDRRVPVLIARDRRRELDDFTQAVLWTRLYVAAATLLGGGAALAAMEARGALPFTLGAGLLSLAAGLCFMLALGPASFHRAASNRRVFGRISITSGLVLALARPAGVLAGGITGCFALLALGYGGLALAVQARMRPLRAARPGARQAGRLLLQGLPLFLASFVWAFYMTANRWVVSLLAPEEELGHFAFGCNVVTLLVGAVGALSQFYYPGVVARAAAGGDFSVSRRVGREFAAMAAALAAPCAAGILLGPVLVGLLYPKFADSVPAMRLLLVSVPGLCVAAWLMPIALSTAARPWAEGLFVYPVGLAVLLAVTWAGYGRGGITGAAYGAAVSAVPLLALQLGALRAARVLLWRDAAAIFAAAVGAGALLWLLAASSA